MSPHNEDNNNAYETRLRGLSPRHLDDNDNTFHYDPEAQYADKRIDSTKNKESPKSPAQQAHTKATQNYSKQNSKQKQGEIDKTKENLGREWGFGFKALENMGYDGFGCGKYGQGMVRPFETSYHSKHDRNIVNPSATGTTQQEQNNHIYGVVTLSAAEETLGTRFYAAETFSGH